MVTDPGIHIESRTIEIRIKNPYQSLDSNTYPTEFSYNIRWKGHFDQSNYWRTVYEPRWGFLKPSSTAETIYTVVVHPIGNEIEMSGWSCYVSANATIDFQVEAFIGGYGGDPFSGWTFTGQTSGWSSTQTLTISSNPTAASSPTHSTASPFSSNPATTSTQPSEETVDLAGFDWEKVAIVVLSVFFGVLLVLVGVLFRRVSKKPS
jgi:hypothetical protein